MTSRKDNKIVFLITIDALRADHLKSYGYHRNTAPNLEKFVQLGTKFQNAFTNGPATPSSFSTIFTSTLPFLNGGYSPLPREKITFSRILKENGIFLFGIHSNPNLGRFYNYGHEFDIFLDGERYKSEERNLKEGNNFKSHLISSLRKIVNYKDLMIKLIFNLPGFNIVKNFLRKKVPKITELLLPFTPMAYNAPFIVNKVLNFLYQGKKPLFIWMHFMDTHSPYNPPSKYVLKFREKDFTLSERKFLNQHVYSNDKSVKITQNLIEDLKILYDAQISFIDDCLKDLFVHIERHYQENCLIIITSDHGESFYEHGIFGHQGSVFDELLKIPLFIREMGKKPIKREVKEPVQLLDIAPTILDFYGLDRPEDFQGKSLLHLIQGKKLNRKKPIITECYQKGGFMKRNNKEGFKLISIRTNDWKYIYDEEKNQEYLFNLKTDPLERDNLINQNVEKARDFRLIRDFHLQKAKETQERSRILSAIDNLNLKK